MAAKCTALQAANYLIYLTDGIYGDMTNMKLNKMLYYAQGYCLKQTGDVLFPERIEAWKHGPVIDSVYQAYKSNGDNPITEYNAEEASRMPKEAVDLLLNVARKYGRYNATSLSGMSHIPKSPWDIVYKEGQLHTPISVDIIKAYFDRYEEDIKEPVITLTEDDYIGTRDNDGILVLPKEYDDEAV